VRREEVNSRSDGENGVPATVFGRLHPPRRAESVVNRFPARRASIITTVRVGRVVASIRFVADPGPARERPTRTGDERRLGRPKRGTLGPEVLCREQHAFDPGAATRWAAKSRLMATGHPSSAPRKNGSDIVYESSSCPAWGVLVASRRPRDHRLPNHWAAGLRRPEEAEVPG